MSIHELTDRRATLSPAKQALLAKLLQGGVAAGPPARPSAIRPRADGGPAPLSGPQRRLWFLDRLEPGSAVFAIPTAVRFSGPLDAAVLGRALVEVVRRHETLRTAFVVRDGTPVQEVRPAPERVLAVEEVPADDLTRRLREEGDAPFDLAAGRVFRARLFRSAPEEHVLAMTLHHIVGDGWSTGVLLRELAALYSAFARGEPSPLPPLPIQYGDFAAWQAERDGGPEVERQLAYWREALAGAPALLELPTDRPRPAVRSSAGAAHAFRMPSALAERLTALARAEGATLFMALVAGLTVVLGRWAGVEDVVLGTPLAGRTREETEELIGFFVQTLALRVGIGGDPTFRGLLGRVRSATVQAYANQEVPFDRLVDDLKVPRSLSHAPVFQVMLALQNLEEGASAAFHGVRAEVIPTAIGSAEDDLRLYVQERPEGLDTVVQYSTDLFDAATVERLSAQFRRVLEEVAEHPDLRVSRVPLLSAAERAEVVSRWNPAPSAFSAVPVHALLSAQAPDAVAVVCGGVSLSYGELDARASGLARVLRSAGVGAESRVGLSMERSAALLVAIVGVWKAGAAYVPVDPAYPAERRAYMLADGGVRVVLTDAASVDDLPAVDAEVVVVDRLPLASEGAASHAENAEGAEDAEGVDARAGFNAREGVDALPEVDPDALAYVIYTSGSTGRPKGVMVPHRGVANFLESMAREPGVGAGDVLVSVTSLSFDIAVLELLLPLTVGARVVVATREEAMEGRRLARLLDASGATVMQATPATWRLLVQSGWAGRPEMVALSGGEALAPELARDLLPRCRALWNLYGPTETTIWSTAHRVAEADRIPLGTPIANTTLYVVDGAGEPAPIGVPGELWIGGAGVVRGYLDRPALTAERFVPDPFGAVGGRLYRTGDRVRRRVDGGLEFLGRVDFQVKVRGFRIELGEIETALREQPGIREAVVVVREDTPGDARIVAYPVFDGAPPSPDALRAALAARLPEHMLPSAYVPLAALPLTPNGKVDRAALPAPDASSAPTDRRPPRTPAEKAIAAIWASVLGTDAFGADSNFFAVGGHSLLLAQVHARLEAHLGRELPLVDLFRHPTIATLAASLAEDGAGTAQNQRGTERAAARLSARATPGRRGGGRP